MCDSWPLHKYKVVREREKSINLLTLRLVKKRVSLLIIKVLKFYSSTNIFGLVTLKRKLNPEQKPVVFITLWYLYDT